MRRILTPVLIALLSLEPVPIFAQQPGQPIQQVVPGGIPFIVQKASASSSGNVTNVAVAFTNQVTKGNSIVVTCGVGNSAPPTVTDTRANTYIQAQAVANGAAFGVAISWTANTSQGADTVTCTNGSAAASMAMEIYEVAGLIALAPQALDDFASNTSTAATTSPFVGIDPSVPNDYAFVAYGLGTAAQTITIANTTAYNGGYVNDSGQLNPSTPNGLFSFVSSSNLLSTVNASTPSATVGVGEPWAVAVACFKQVIFPVQGSMILSPPTVSTFWSGIVGLVPATTATDIFTIIGSSTRKILIIKVYVSCTQTTAGTINVQLVKRSTADTSGTSTTPALVPYDSGDPAATTVVRAYTANPTLGTLVGVGRPYKLACLAPATATPTDIIYEQFGNGIGAPIQLNSAAEQFAVSLCSDTACTTGTTVSGGSFDIWIEFIER